MLKALIKKELLQLNQFYIFSNKTKELKSKKQIIKTAVLYVVLLLFISTSLGALYSAFALSLISAGFGWLYFSITGLISVVLGVFGDVFNTYNLLYKAKDNDLLLSMPIPPSKLLFSRILDVYLMGMLYATIAYLPATVVYWIFAKITLLNVLFPIIIWIVLGFFVAVLTCVLGWVVAVITTKLQNKSITRVLATLVFLSIYYVVYFKAINKLQDIAMYTDQIAGTISQKTLLLYHMGRAAAGNAVSLLIYIAVVAVLFALTCLAMSRTYIKLVTTNKGTKKVKYEKKESKKSSVAKALLRKELNRFTASSNYLLNTGIGSLIMLIGAVVLLIKMKAVREVLPVVEVLAQELAWIANLVPAALAVIPVFILSMCYPSAPSISLEGKEIWILQSMPVDGKMILRAKMKMHLVIVMLPAIILSAALCFVFRLSWICSILVILVHMLYVCFEDVFGLWIDSKKYNLNWTNEVYPIKQGTSITLTLFGGWGVAMVFAGIFFLTRNIFSAPVFLVLLCVILAVVTEIIYHNLMTKAAKEFTFYS